MLSLTYRRRKYYFPYRTSDSIKRLQIWQEVTFVKRNTDIRYGPAVKEKAISQALTGFLGKNPISSNETQPMAFCTHYQ